jgi:uroporphyrinogen-III synthase
MAQLLPQYLPITVLVTRSAGQSSQFSELLMARGAQVIEMPALEIKPPSSWELLDTAIKQLNQYAWLVLTSANAVNSFMDRLKEVGNQEDLLTLKIAVVGKKTASILERYGLKPDFMPPDFVADSLVADFPEPVANLSILFPRVESGGREILVNEMTAAGAWVTEAPAYESGCPQQPNEQAIVALQSQAVDIITFASSKTVRHACQLLAQGLGADWAQYLKTVAVASIGPKTSETCLELIGRVDIEAAEYTLEGLTQAIAEWASASLD